MTESALTYFKLYYKLDRLVDEYKEHTPEAAELRKQLNVAYHNMTERERELLDIVGKNNIKEQ